MLRKKNHFAVNLPLYFPPIFFRKFAKVTFTVEICWHFHLLLRDCDDDNNSNDKSPHAVQWPWS